MYGMYTFGRFFLVGKVFLFWFGFTFNDDFSFSKKGGHFKELFENGRIGGDS